MQNSGISNHVALEWHDLETDRTMNMDHDALAD